MVLDFLADPEVQKTLQGLVVVVGIAASVITIYQAVKPKKRDTLG